MTTIVLIPGAMHGAWVFEPLLAELSERGLTAVAVDLPSSSADTASIGSLTDDVDAIRAAVADIDGPVVLAAHSYGGVPARAAAGTIESVRGLVMIAAFALPVGASLLQAQGGEFPPSYERSADGRGVKIGDIAETIYSGVPQDVVERALPRVQWQSVESFTQPAPAEPGPDVTVTTVIATEDKALPADQQRQWAEASDAQVSVASGHSPHVSHPGVVADAIADTVRRVDAAS
ncbi:alpha/beta fold hydrolase [Microbacterium sp. NPDC090007]|uniref:alpha/beta fold hydrolase n=1 Tax=Microbacterium sp. NPDC090007 TaxID=3364204 RepID=UPI0037F858FC